MMSSAPQLAGSFGPLDWGVVLVVLALTTAVGARMAGRQTTTREFFLGGRRLPWYAVAASIAATEISAVTYVSVPWVVYQEGGDLTYLQIGLFGSLLTRAFVGYVLVPAYYQREIYSPYDYVGQRLGEGARQLTTGLFTLGGILAQSARVYLTALVLEVILHAELVAFAGLTGIPPLVAAVGAIGLVSVLWTWMGGIATVVWTDVILFMLFFAGVAVALITVDGAVDGGLLQVWRDAGQAGKLRLIDTELSLTKPFTLWAALFAASWGQVGIYGCDQLMTQRLFCCRDARQARWAMLASVAAVLVIFLVQLVGLALWAYYREHPMSEAGASLVAEDGDRIFPVFATEVVPAGLKGLLVAGVFAAAISSLDSIMAALSQTTLSALYLPWRRRRREARGPEEPREARESREARHTLAVSRALVLGWGLLLCAGAVGMQWVAREYDSILNLALAMSGYTGGALLAGVALALAPLRPRSRGFQWSAPLSVMVVFAVVWHEPWAQVTCALYTVGVLSFWAARRRPLGASGALVLALGALNWVCADGTFPGGKVLAWPYYIPIGCLVAFLFALLLDHQQERDREPGRELYEDS